jgi:chromatin modification-related protein VID21
MTVAQRANGGIPQTQVVPQIRSQVNISQQQRIGTPSMPVGNARVSPQQFLQAQQQAQQLRTAQQQAQQTQNQAQNNVSGTGPGPTNNAHLSTPHGTRDITSSPAHVSPPHGSTVMSNVVNSPRPPSAQAQALLQVQVPANAAARPVTMANYYLSNMSTEQIQTALRLQMQVSSFIDGEH